MPMRKQQPYKFLSKSILLEEQGLPHIQKITILTISLMIVLFITWANFMTIEDKVSIKGYAERDYFNDCGFEFLAMVPSDEISAISYGDKINLSISGLTNKHKIPGIIEKINTKPTVDKSGRVYYQITVKPSLNQDVMKNIQPMLYDKMETRIEVIVGTRTLLQYFLGPLWDASRSTAY